MLTTAHNRLRNAGFSQLPVMEGERIVGIIDEDAMLLHAFGEPERFRDPVRAAMHTNVPVVEPKLGLHDLVAMLEAQPYAAVMDDGEFLGLITRIDLLNYLRRQMTARPRTEGSMKDTKKPLGFSTRAIHAGQSPDPTTGAVMPPIYATSTYAQESPGVHKGFEYSRTHNPTRFAYERCVAALEGGTRGFAFASGMAATSTVLELLDSGDHVIAWTTSTAAPSACSSACAGARRPRLQLRRPVRPEGRGRGDPAEHAHDLGRDADQPDAQLVDIAAVAEDRAQARHPPGRRQHLRDAVIQRPLELGADIVMHSATKYLNGHSDMVGGVVVVRDAELAERMAFLQNAIGAVAGRSTASSRCAA